MAPTPNVLGRRYAPLLALAAVQILLVVLAPSVPGTTSKGGLNALGTGGTGGTGTIGTGAGGTSGLATGGGGGGALAGSSVGGGSSIGASGGGGGASGATGGGGSSVTGGGSSTGPAPGTGQSSGGIGYTSTDMSHCAANGQEVGPTYYMPKCVPVWHGGNNGGATMTGVTATEIRYVYYNAQGNPQVNQILNAENLAATNSQVCAAIQAFTAELNKRFEFYGRKLVSMDGPSSGNHQGSAQQSDCNFPYFQGQCSLTPPDPPCEKAEAQVIAAMHPAFVIAHTGLDNLYAGLAQAGIMIAGGSAGGENMPESYFDQLAPYFYNIFPTGTQTMDQLAEYYCKKLSGKPVQFGGPEVQTLNGVTAPPPVRKVAITFPVNNGDPVYKIAADQLVKLIDGGQCGTSKSGTEEFAYASDINTAQTQSNTTVAGIKQDHITTVVCFCDPIAPVFLSNTLAEQNYHPEILLPGSGLLDYDVLGQLYNQDVWRHAFGPSELQDPIPFAQSDAVKAFNDGGYAGQPDQTENRAWAYYSLMGTAFQTAGPNLTPANMRLGLTNLGPMGGSPNYPLFAYKGNFPWTGIKDFREVWYCPTSVSPINGHPGTYMPVNGGVRYQLGQLQGGTAGLFPNGFCAP